MKSIKPCNLVLWGFLMMSLIKNKVRGPLPYQNVTMKKKIYISIPISGLPVEEVKKRASELKEALTSGNTEAVTPFDVCPDADVPENYSDKARYAYFMGRDIEALLNCDAVFMCNGWQTSNGCRAEYFVAWIYGKEIIIENNSNVTMKRKEVKEKVIKVIERRVLDWYDGEITEDKTFKDMGCDSLDTIELTVDIERAFCISPRDAEWAEAKTVGQWIDLVVKHLD